MCQLRFEIYLQGHQQDQQQQQQEGSGHAMVYHKPTRRQKTLQFAALFSLDGCCQRTTMAELTVGGRRVGHAAIRRCDVCGGVNACSFMKKGWLQETFSMVLKDVLKNMHQNDEVFFLLNVAGV